MRVQSINQQNYRKQNTPFFQAAGILISREIKGEAVSTVARKLVEALDAKGVSSVVRSAVGENEVLDHIAVNTSLKEQEDAAISLVRQFASQHGFECQILPGYSKDADALGAFGRLKARAFERNGHL